MRSQFVKTKLCPFFSTGNCAAGDQCTYAHSKEELRPMPNLHKTKLCSSVTRKHPCENPLCSYAHSENELRTSTKLMGYKTILCFFHMRGTCLNGTKCRFAHGKLELRDDSSNFNPLEEVDEAEEDEVSEPSLLSSPSINPHLVHSKETTAKATSPPVVVTRSSPPQVKPKTPRVTSKIRTPKFRQQHLANFPGAMTRNYPQVIEQLPPNDAPPYCQPPLAPVRFSPFAIPQTEDMQPIKQPTSPNVGYSPSVDALESTSQLPLPDDSSLPSGKDSLLSALGPQKCGPTHSDPVQDALPDPTPNDLFPLFLFEPNHELLKAHLAAKRRAISMSGYEDLEPILSVKHAIRPTSPQLPEYNKSVRSSQNSIKELEDYSDCNDTTNVPCSPLSSSHRQRSPDPWGEAADQSLDPTAQKPHLPPFPLYSIDGTPSTRPDSSYCGSSPHSTRFSLNKLSFFPPSQQSESHTYSLKDLVGVNIMDRTNHS